VSTAPADVVLEARDLEVRWGKATLVSVPRFEVRRGEVLAIMGPNGSGKTTLLLTLALLNSPSAGSIRLEGEPVSSRSLLRLRRQMAVVFQEPLLLDTSVAENVGMGLKLRGIAAAERARRVSASSWWRAARGVRSCPWRLPPRATFHSTPGAG